MGAAGSKAIKAKLQQQEQQVLTAQQTIQTQEKRLADEAQQKANATREVEALKSQLLDLDAKWSVIEQDREKQIAQLKSQLSQQIEEVDGQRRTATGLRQERDGARDRLERLIKDKRTLENEKRDLAQEAARLQDTLKDFDSKHETALKALRDESEESRQGADIIRQNHALLTSRLTETEEAALAAVKRQTALQDELVETKTAFSATQQRLQDLNARLSDMQTQIEFGQTKLSEKDIGIVQLREQLSRSELRRDALDKELSVYKDGATDVERQLGSQRVHALQLQTELATTRSQLEKAEALRLKAQMERNHNVTQKTSMHEAFEALKMELRDSHEQWRKLNEENSLLRGQLNAQQTTAQNGLPTSPNLLVTSVR